ncbi:hypothetical protein MKK84_27255 [Methylobacterium sp. E-065]|uniref:hypothetical protein n=1 Tax=Methylobacterium sp. E-065 TaxID=2836583 RepID=UPI001FB8DF79|nr:hypothetical protein [Methylobacterium sp. E-065]MCJ2021077.1 hypothetical protein [Methylobacterium sp. E-065]
MAKRNPIAERPKALCIQELPHGGYIVTAFPRNQYETQLLAAFTRLTDAVGWMEEAMRVRLAEQNEPSLVEA